MRRCRVCAESWRSLMILLGDGPRVSRSLLGFICFGVTPIAFWIRKNSKIHEHTIPLRSPPLFFSSLLHSSCPRHSHPDFSLRIRLRSASFFEDILLVGAIWLVREFYHFIDLVPQKTCGPGQDLRYLEGNIASSWIKMARLITRRGHPVLSGGQSILR